MIKILIMVITIGIISAQDFEYVGSKKCKMCHNKAKTGAQYKIWESTSHAHSYETLKSEEAAKIAKELNLGVPAFEADTCLVCHTTGYGKGGYEVKDEKFWSQKTAKGKPTKEVKRMANLQSVGCEACHGPGSKYKSKKVMEAVFRGDMEGQSVGLWIPDEKTCVQCHNPKNPTHKPFKYKERMEKIAHPYPADMKK